LIHTLYFFGKTERQNRRNALYRARKNANDFRKKIPYFSAFAGMAPHAFPLLPEWHGAFFMFYLRFQRGFLLSIPIKLSPYSTALENPKKRDNLRMEMEIPIFGWRFPGLIDFRFLDFKPDGTNQPAQSIED
jgi:hypothetical protein